MASRGERYVALFLDGKSFADALMVIALGVTADGSKRFPGFVESETEKEKVLTPFLRSMIERGLDPAQGLLGGDRWRQRPAPGSAAGVPEEGVGATVPMAQTRERRELPAEERTGELAPATAARL